MISLYVENFIHFFGKEMIEKRQGPQGKNNVSKLIHPFRCHRQTETDINVILITPPFCVEVKIWVTLQKVIFFTVKVF